MSQRNGSTQQIANRLTQRTFLPYPALLCHGIEPHYSPMPSVSSENATGPVECAECGAAMSVVDVITVRDRALWSEIHYLGQGRRYFGV